jgi:hypothetical protein
MKHLPVSDGGAKSTKDALATDKLARALKQRGEKLGFSKIGDIPEDASGSGLLIKGKLSGGK